MTRYLRRGCGGLDRRLHLRARGTRPPAFEAVDSATEAPESGWFLAYSSLGRRVIGEIIPESCIHLCEEPGAIWGKQIGNPGVHPHLTEKCPLKTATYRPSTQ